MSKDISKVVDKIENREASKSMHYGRDKVITTILLIIGVLIIVYYCYSTSFKKSNEKPNEKPNEKKLNKDLTNGVNDEIF